MKIKLLRVEHGDAIWISDNHKNILVDTGPAVSYEIVKNLQDDIHKSGEKIDLLVISHIDDDHIGGLLTLVEKNEFIPELYKEIWINKGQDYFVSNGEHSIANGRPLIEKLEELELNIVNEVSSDIKKDIGEMLLRVISPTKGLLETMQISWEGTKSRLHASENDNLVNLEYYASCKHYRSDRSIQNKASISFILKYKENEILFTGDADSKSLLLGFEEVGIEEPIKFTAIKLPHHGSEYNINPVFLEKFHSENYFVCTNGIGGKPPKQTLAWLINSSPNSCVNLYCNYTEWQERRFTKADITDYIDSEKLKIIDVSTSSIDISNEVVIKNDE